MKTHINFGRWVNCVLTAPLLWTDDDETADKSIFQWKIYPLGDEGPQQYVCSILGMINGILPKFDLVLVTEQPEDATDPKGWRLRIRRWSAMFPGVNPSP